MRPNENREPTTAERAAADALINHVNRYSSDMSGVAAALTQTHPTLQQGVMRVFVAFVREMAAKPYTDARNEASAEVARKIVASWEAEFGEDDAVGPRGPYLPFV